MPAAGTSTKSDERRRAIVAAAIDCFAQKGFYGTTTHEIAEWVGISQPYLYRLYPNKEALFAAAVDHVSVVMTETLVAHSPASGGGAEAASGPASEAALDAARGAYAALVADRAILRFLMHANCAAGEPLVGQAVRRCYAKQVDTVRQLLGDDDAVRRWFGAGMLDNVVAVLGLADIDEPWARVLAAR
jgi:AcrR family transcriptional regulator